jgi:hypothetical protein
MITKHVDSMAVSPKIVRHDIELLRIISTFGIVWFHAGVVGAEFAYSGLVVFVILSVYFGAYKISEVKPVGERAKRFILPYVVWSFVYAAASFFIGRPLISPDYGVVALLLAGPGPHLWYLPFMFLTLVAVDNLKWRGSPKLLATIGIVAALAFFFYASKWRGLTNAMGFPWAQYAHAVPGVCVGLFMAYAQSFSAPVRLLLVVILMVSALSVISVKSLGIPYSIGIGVCAIVLLTQVLNLFNSSPFYRASQAIGLYAADISAIFCIFIRCVCGIFDAQIFPCI